MCFIFAIAAGSLSATDALYCIQIQKKSVLVLPVVSRMKSGHLNMIKGSDVPKF
ncbi:hypothetical protein SEVIR_8G090701v4 [Setaria viridis]|uniref:Uncharacterized protein n=1 Tax=Setaria viridis TaxID=4556 RepID=A0A4U6TH49_SETVI|nr:hypothetical protein SEVIR_8G090701v2 [Setaria viridis]